MHVDPDKIIAAILTGVVVKVGEKGIAFLKARWKARRARKLASKKTLTLTGSRQKPYFASSFSKKAFETVKPLISFSALKKTFGVLVARIKRIFGGISHDTSKNSLGSDNSYYAGDFLKNVPNTVMAESYKKKSVGHVARVNHIRSVTRQIFLKKTMGVAKLVATA